MSCEESYDWKETGSGKAKAHDLSPPKLWQAPPAGQITLGQPGSSPCFAGQLQDNCNLPLQFTGNFWDGAWNILQKKLMLCACLYDHD